MVMVMVITMSILISLYFSLILGLNVEIYCMLSSSTTVKPTTKTTIIIIIVTIIVIVIVIVILKEVITIAIPHITPHCNNSTLIIIIISRYLYHSLKPIITNITIIVSINLYLYLLHRNLHHIILIHPPIYPSLPLFFHLHHSLT